MADTKAMNEDERRLAELGYKQELSRTWSGFSNFAISFSIICILSGGINSFAQAIGSVGGAGAGIGWIVGCILSGMFALAMAQIASAFPTAGGLYHWGSILGNRFVGWMTAWLNLVLFLGAVTGVRILIGLVAIAGGAWYLYEWKTHRDEQCGVTAAPARRARRSAAAREVSGKSSPPRPRSAAARAAASTTSRLRTKRGYPRVMCRNVAGSLRS